MDIFSQSARKLKNILDDRQSILRDIRNGKREHIHKGVHLFSIYDYEFCLTVIVDEYPALPGLSICSTIGEIVTVRTDMSTPDMWLHHYNKSNTEIGETSNTYLLNITNVGSYKVPMDKCRRDINNSIDNFREIYKLSKKPSTYREIHNVKTKCDIISLIYFNNLLGGDYSHLKTIHAVEVSLNKLNKCINLEIQINDIYQVRHNVLQLIESCRLIGTQIPTSLQRRIRMALKKTGDLIIPVIDNYMRSLKSDIYSEDQLSTMVYNEAFYCDNLVDFLRPYNKSCENRTKTVASMLS